MKDSEILKILGMLENHKSAMSEIHKTQAKLGEASTAEAELLVGMNDNILKLINTVEALQKRIDALEVKWTKN
jgi:hypothetical protein